MVMKAFTILFGTILGSVLLTQIAINAASDIEYWEVGKDSSGRLLWCGVVAAGLLIGGAILVLLDARLAAGAFVVSLPLLVLYEGQHNRNLLSLAVDKSIAGWIGAGIVLAVVSALVSHASSNDENVRS